MTYPDMMTPDSAQADSAEDVIRICGTAGLGHPGATLAYATVWFRDRLYVGTCAPSARGPQDCARILTHDPVTDTWATVFESPVMALDDAMQDRAARLGYAAAGQRRTEAVATAMGRDYGIRDMVVFQGKSDLAPCLYCATLSIGGGLILRSEDGLDFAPVSSPGIDDDTQMGFLGLTAHAGKLFAAPTGTITAEGIDRNIAPQAMVYVSDDPASGVWTQACTPGFDDPANMSVFALVAAHDHLYAGTGNPVTGFQLWRTRAAVSAPYDWEQVLVNGGWRFTHNLMLAQMAVFNDDLYLGSGITGFGYDRRHDIGPAAAELLRVRRDGSWDLLMGEPRFTPDGLKVPLSALGPGFANPYNSMIWSLGVHDGVLYAGTHNWEPNHWAMEGGGQNIQGGFELWASLDGETWTCVLYGGHGKVTSVGIRSLCSTPEGLYLTTTNQTKLIARQALMRSGIENLGADLTEGFDVLLAT